MNRSTVVTAQERMTRARLFAGIDQLEMANILGKSRNTISAWERGVNEPPLSAIAQWALLTGRSIDWIVWGDEGRPSGVLVGAGANEKAPAEAGANVRPEGFEPPAYWSVVSPPLTVEALQVIWAAADVLDAVAHEPSESGSVSP